MSSYTVLARKYRPAQFSDIVGQTAVVRTLMNTIRSERLHQAYLFTGSRGIGKTSIARIFAKAIRCPNPIVTDQDYRSCDQCSSCEEISKSTSVDVLEIDGASNNGVDSVREIRESAKYLPSTGQKKIYIIDEVHMLSTAAFNALLKTLEEPPPHVIFIFATTEPHKIPATILSRCQRFDFKRVTVAQARGRLEEILKAEKMTAEGESLTLIAQAAEGSMRDALSILDQVISYSGNHVTPEKVRESLGLIPSETLLLILENVGSRNIRPVLNAIDAAYAQGLELRNLLKSLIETLHDVIVLKAGAELAHASQTDRLESIANKRSLEEWELIFQVLHHGLSWVAHSPNQKNVLDVLLIKCTLGETLIPADHERGQPSASTPSPQTTQQPTPVALAPKPVVSVAPTIASADRSWAHFLKFVAQKRPLLSKLLEHGDCQGFPKNEGETLKLNFHPEHAYKKEQLQVKAYQDQLRLLLNEYFLFPVGMQFTLDQSAKESVAQQRARSQQERFASARSNVINHPIIKEAKALFGAELGAIEFLESEHH